VKATVVGAGVFGASTALALVRRGCEVTLVEQYVPGHVRSASGGDTRLIRFAHGTEEWYTALVWRARGLWRELERDTGATILDERGLAWFASGDGAFEDASEPVLRKLGIEVERLDPGEARQLFPSLRTDDLRFVLYEPQAGLLYARRATQALVEQAVREGVRLRPGRVEPSSPPAGDVVVWACGAWLPRLFPGLARIRISKRDVFFFGAGAEWVGTPGWCDYDGACYGHGEAGGLGVKIAPDAAGVEIDPDTLERLPSPSNVALAHEYAERRFPALKTIVGSRVCQYALTPDAHFVIAPHPEREGWWLLGGGSGHGFKHGPALGEHVAELVEGKVEPDPRHGLGVRRPGAGLRTATIET
jgi:glycine/D-amino acid oxidase-like deaminating enzyme